MRFPRWVSWCRLLPLMWIISFPDAADAQSARPFQPGRAAEGYQPLVDLCEGWKTEGEGGLNAPFELKDCGKLTLTKEFVLTETDSTLLPDTLYLYMEGLAWTGEVYLNGKFLFTVDGPFREHLHAVPAKLFKKAKPSLYTPSSVNILSLVLEDDDRAYYLYPQRVCGIIRPVWLLEAGGAVTSRGFPPIVPTADTVVIFPPWLPEAGYLWEQEPYRIRLAETRALGGRNLFFPFPPSGALLTAAAEMGFRQVLSLEGAKVVAFSHGYPMGLSPGNLPTQGWRDTEGRTTESYGTFVSLEEFRSRPSQEPSRASLIILLITPFVFLLLLRMLGPRIYQSFPQYLTKTKINFELIRDGKFLKQEQTMIMTLIQLILMSASLSMLLYFIQISGDFQRLNLLSSESLLHRMFAGASFGLFRYFLTVFIYLLCLTIFKYVLLTALGIVYRQSDLASGMANLDVLAAFPFNFLPFVPAAFAFFWKYEYGGAMLVVWMILYGLYFLRRIYLTFAGTSHLFKLSGSLKILYICTFEILPWVILI